VDQLFVNERCKSRFLSPAPMRKVSQLALSLTLLATQVNVPKFNFGNVADADPAPAAPASVYEVKLDTVSPTPVQIVGQPQPNYDTQVLGPLHSAQAQEAAAALAAALARHRRTVITRPAPVVNMVPGSHVDWMVDAGIAERDYGYVDYIISHESGWVWTKYNYRGSGAYGLGQALPASKMAAYGGDYMTSPITQLKWANAYALGRYGSWAAAYAHWLAHHSW